MASTSDPLDPVREYLDHRFKTMPRTPSWPDVIEQAKSNSMARQKARRNRVAVLGYRASRPATQWKGSK